MTEYQKAANRLHHLSMRYVGALHECAKGEKVGIIAQNHPGNREMRDLIDLVLLTRAEINGITELLVKKGITTTEELQKIFAGEYEWLTKQKAQQLGVEVTDVGLVFSNDPSKN